MAHILFPAEVPLSSKWGVHAVYISAFGNDSSDGVLRWLEMAEHIQKKSKKKIGK